MRFIILLVFTLGLFMYAHTQTPTIPAGACPGLRDNLLDCFDQLIDTDHNGNITAAELDAAFIAHADCLPSNTTWTDTFNTAFVLAQCDTTGSGYLNSTDWNDPNACLTDPNSIEYVCRACYMCGYTPLVKKK